MRFCADPDHRVAEQIVKLARDHRAKVDDRRRHAAERRHRRLRAVAVDEHLGERGAAEGGTAAARCPRSASSTTPGPSRLGREGRARRRGGRAGRRAATTAATAGTAATAATAVPMAATRTAPGGARPDRRSHSLRRRISHGAPADQRSTEALAYVEGSPCIRRMRRRCGRPLPAARGSSAAGYVGSRLSESSAHWFARGPPARADRNNRHS